MRQAGVGSFWTRRKWRKVRVCRLGCGGGAWELGLSGRVEQAAPLRWERICLPMQETGDAGSTPGWDDPLKEEVATHCRVPVGCCPWSCTRDGPE